MPLNKQEEAELRTLVARMAVILGVGAVKADDMPTPPPPPPPPPHDDDPIG